VKDKIHFWRAAPVALLSAALLGAMLLASPFVGTSEASPLSAAATCVPNSVQSSAYSPYSPYASQQASGPTYNLYGGQQATYSGSLPDVDVPGVPDYDCTYVVQPGDDLFRIGLRYGVTVNDMARANFLSNPNRIFAGMLLRVPCGVAPTEPSPQPCIRAVHIVQPGEDLFRIGLRYGVSPAVLAAFNHISNPNEIYAGMSIAIPCFDSYSPSDSYTYPTPTPSSTIPPTPTPTPVAEPTSTATSGQAIVVMRNLAFNPADVTIHVGQTVVWQNQDSVAHTTTSGSCSGNVCTPSPGWDSGILNPGQSFSHTFNAAGTFTYYCKIHGAAMQGVVRVMP
jgi:plastocyanin/LysM repeat protein